MMAIANRLRGTWAIMAKVNGAMLGLIVFLITGKICIAASVAILYIAGESMGWGKWIGGIMAANHGPATRDQMNDKEGTNNGIDYIASKIAPPLDNYFVYCVMALAIRGFYWWAITLIPLLIGGYIELFYYLFSSFVLGVAFPISVIVGIETARLFKLKVGKFEMIGAWEHGEVWYGLIQDIMLISLMVISI